MFDPFTVTVSWVIDPFTAVDTIVVVVRSTVVSVVTRAMRL